MQLNDLQQKLNQAFHDAQARARELENEARKVLEALDDRARAEMKVRFAHAREVSRGQAFSLGVELEKLGKRLQQIAAAPVAAQSGATQPPPNVAS